MPPWITSRLFVAVAAAAAGSLSAGMIALGQGSATTDTNVACATATATVPDHTVAVDTTPVDTIAGAADTETQCNTATYTVSTSTETVTDTGTGTGTSSSTTSSTSSSTSSTTTSSTTTSPPPPSSGFVPSAPSGPATPAGGWDVRYADHFDSCLTDAATNCSLGGARQDDTLGSVTNRNGAGNGNEIDAAVPSEVDVAPAGLVLSCHHKPALTDFYSCGFVSDGAHNSVAPGGFHWTPSANLNLVLEAAIQFPPNQGNMDPSFWINGPSDNPEVDNPEGWGMNHFPPAGATNTWCGFQFGDPAVPFDSGGATGNLQFTFCHSPGANLDPSDGLHRWTLQEQGLTLTSYLDGVKLGSRTYSGFNSGGASFKMLLENSMRQDPPCCGPRDGYPFPVNGNQMVFRYVAAYEPASDNGAGTNTAPPRAPIIVPGTTVGP